VKAATWSQQQNLCNAEPSQERKTEAIDIKALGYGEGGRASNQAA